MLKIAGEWQGGGHRRAEDLDFWLGTWDCSWDGGSGRNTVTRELGGHVVVERFEAFGADAFDGLSVQRPDPVTGGWRQTWVDSTGSYWAFLGGLRSDGTFVLGTPDRVDADRLHKRMIFSEIGPDGFGGGGSTLAGPAPLDVEVGDHLPPQRAAGVTQDRLRVALLGPLELSTAAAPVEVRGVRLRGLLARLALDPRLDRVRHRWAPASVLLVRRPDHGGGPACQRAVSALSPALSRRPSRDGHGSSHGDGPVPGHDVRRGTSTR